MGWGDFPVEVAFPASSFSAKKCQLLYRGIEQWRQQEELIDPHEQVATDEQMLAQ